MAVTVFTSDGSGLLAAIKKRIDSGGIDTWSYDKDGDFTHSVAQWKNLAWMRPRPPQSDKIVFNILGKKDTQMSRATYGIYHGRFIEMLVTHFDAMFSSASASALGTTGDTI